MPIRSNGQADRSLIKIFLSRSYRKREELVRRAEKLSGGTYCVLLPGALGNYSRRGYPELYQNGRLHEMDWEMDGKNRRLTIVYPLTSDLLQKVRTIRGRIIVPNTQA